MRYYGVLKRRECHASYRRVILLGIKRTRVPLSGNWFWIRITGRPDTGGAAVAGSSIERHHHRRHLVCAFTRTRRKTILPTHDQRKWQGTTRNPLAG
ncbi:hypothetical protein V1477_001142 [Vespula maculifrons]|uniref:Uncharacterized protein n=1 Tax=Vespula maculifrons TaxID=7453 RepID=A0ABD2CZR5_VESMC